MNISIINKIVRSMCVEVKAQQKMSSSWESLSEEEILYEVAICMFSSQMVFEVATAIVNRLRTLGYFKFPVCTCDFFEYEKQIVAVLSEPILIHAADGIIRSIHPRFKNRLASLLATTCRNIYGQGVSIKSLLESSTSPKHARQLLVQKICGFGPKQASLFLRRVTYCSDLAVLDVHILDYLRIARGLTVHVNRLTRLPAYEQVENEFRDVAKEFGYSLGCVDLATWVTMRVAKREAYL